MLPAENREVRFQDLSTRAKPGLHSRKEPEGKPAQNEFERFNFLKKKILSVCAHAIVHTWRSEDNTMEWAPWIQFRSLGLPLGLHGEYTGRHPRDGIY